MLTIMLFTRSIRPICICISVLYTLSIPDKCYLMLLQLRWFRNASIMHAIMLSIYHTFDAQYYYLGHRVTISLDNGIASCNINGSSSMLTIMLFTRSIRHIHSCYNKVLDLSSMLYGVIVNIN